MVGKMQLPVDLTMISIFPIIVLQGVTQMDLVKELKVRIEETKSLLDNARKAAAKAKAEEDTLANDLSAYQRTLDAEWRRTGHVERNEVPHATRDFELSAALGGDEDVRVNKVRLMREL